MAKQDRAGVRPGMDKQVRSPYRKAKASMPRAEFLRMLVLFAATFFSLYILMLAALSPERHDLDAGDIAPKTITASKDIVDEITTQERIDNAVTAVQPHYVADTGAMSEVLAAVSSGFDKLEQVRAAAEQTISALREAAPDDIEPSEEQIENALDTDTTIAWASGILTPIVLNKAELYKLQLMSREQLTALNMNAQRIIRDAMISQIAEGQEEQSLDKLELDLCNLYGADETTASIAREAVEPYLRANLLMDTEVTEANRQKAADSIEPVVYKKGQNIVREGEVITRSQLAVLQSLGLIRDNTIDFMLYIGLFLLLVVMFSLLIWYVMEFAPKMFSDASSTILLCIIMASTVLICLLMRTISMYIMPFAMGAMLVALLLRHRLAILVNMILATLAGLMAAGTDTELSGYLIVDVMVCVFAAGTVGVYVIRRYPHRLGVLGSGVASGAVGMISMISVGLINNSDLNSVFTSSVWALGSGVLSSIICIGLQPLFEFVFRLTTPTKLMELANPQQPLLRRLLLEAPGTYHHSIIVANLAEAAADAIGANGLLARVGAYYHDVGKLKRPLYFKENQVGDNPHDRTDPRISAAILIAHPKDGAQMGERSRLPQPVLDIIRQHHGDTPCAYFYHKALQQSKNGEVDINNFRYDGPKPQTVEAGIVMLADTVEAAARAMPSPTRDRVDNLIRDLVKGKIDDAQLDECPLTYRDVDTICKTFLSVLTGVFHQRIEYPSVDIPDRSANALPNTLRTDEEIEAEAKQIAGKVVETMSNGQANSSKPASSKMVKTVKHGARRDSKRAASIGEAVPDSAEPALSEGYAHNVAAPGTIAAAKLQAGSTGKPGVSSKIKSSMGAAIKTIASGNAFGKHEDAASANGSGGASPTPLAHSDDLSGSHSSVDGADGGVQQGGSASGEGE